MVALRNVGLLADLAGLTADPPRTGAALEHAHDAQPGIGGGLARILARAVLSGLRSDAPREPLAIVAELRARHRPYPVPRGARLFGRDDNAVMTMPPTARGR